MRFMSPEEALALLQTAERIHAREEELPPEIIAIGIAIEKATRRAHLFMIRLGRVDEGMVNEVVALKLQRDALLAEMFRGGSQSNYSS